MKCEVCQELLEEYLDGELATVEQEEISAHLITCADCSASFSTLAAEQELFSRYDRELEVPPFLWTRIAQDTVAANNSGRLGWRHHAATIFARPIVAAAVAILLIAIAVGVLNTKDPTLPRDGTDFTQATSVPQRGSVGSMLPETGGDQPTQQPDPRPITQQPKHKTRRASRAKIDQSGVLSSDLGYVDLYERDTAKHIEKTQNLLRSIRNVSVSEGDEEIDVTYDKALSRRLLNENVVLRRDAEMKAKFPTKSLLADVEPFLIDIANLPDHARPEDVRVIKERVQKTEIVAALMDYQGRSPNNR
jgi:anti-sigma factor RsiW